MIVRISKVEIAGPRELLKETLTLLYDTGTLQIEADAVNFIEKNDLVYLESFVSDAKTLTERFFYEDLKGRIDELLSYLPDRAVRSSGIEPLAIIDTINETLRKHLPLCRDLTQKKEKLQTELRELNRYSTFLDAVEPLVENVTATPDLEFIGLTLRNDEAKQLLREVLTYRAEGKFELITSVTEDGTIVGLVTVSRDVSGNIKAALSDNDIPELRFPPSFSGMDLVDKIRFLRSRTNDLSGEIEEMDMRLDNCAAKWGAIYRRVREWLDEKLSILRAAAYVYETKMCFFFYGWIASADVRDLATKLNRQFSGKVVLQEMEIREEESDRMPVILKNPPYFRPFELLTKILPLPRYTSYDPTPFIGIFFPLFFGMILGDSGYGLLLMITSLIMIRRFRKNRNVTDAFKILFVASLYSFFFGILYGEFFGELGHKLFGLEALLVERRTSVIPMLYFAVTVGVIHIILGSFLALLTALKKKTGRRAVYHLFHILIIICILALIASIFGKFPSLMTKPIIILILIFTPLMLFTGGLLAPLEIIKSIGNIISYARIMAIGLTSVLLAFVANRLAGMTGDIVLGIVVASLIHLLNIIIGVFSPTIHSLRLHYVEFFSKFIETGGRKFEPLKKGR
jgi:V/A-type H+-transporting ATPase subunit I